MYAIVLCTGVSHAALRVPLLQNVITCSGEVWQKPQSDTVAYDRAEAGHFDGVERVPAAGCVPRSRNAPGVDFMTGGLPGQATQDLITAESGVTGFAERLHCRLVGRIFRRPGLVATCSRHMPVALVVDKTSACRSTSPKSQSWHTSFRRATPSLSCDSQLGSWELGTFSKIWMEQPVSTRPWSWQTCR